MTGQKILVIEDEKDIAELVRYNLTRDGFAVTCCHTGEDGLRVARTERPDLILLDLMLPGLDGLEVCRALKSDQNTNTVPIVMLTAKSEDADIVTGLEIGADDYITKPFSPRVLVARLRAVLRRKAKDAVDDSRTLRINEIAIDPGRHEVRVDDTPVTLTTTEFRLLQFLAGRPGWVFTRDQIVDNIHGDDAVVTDRTVDVHVAGLRKKLGKHGEYVETVRGVGYRFRE